MAEETKKPDTSAVATGTAERAAQAESKFARAAQHGRGDRRDRRNRGGFRPRKPEAPKEFDDVTIAVNRVARVVKGGRRFRFQALVVIGNHKEKVGVGVAKGGDVQAAVNKAIDCAKKSVVVIPITKNTIPHEIEVKHTGAHVLLKPAAPGTGIIAGGVVRQIIGLTGINNLISKSLGSTNKINIAYATVNALSQLVPKDQWLGAKKSAQKTEKKGEK